MAKFKLGNIRGPQGPPGVSGKSAYEEWKTKGNQGSFDDFMIDIGKKGDFITKQKADEYYQTKKISKLENVIELNTASLIMILMPVAKFNKSNDLHLNMCFDFLSIAFDKKGVQISEKYDLKTKKLGKLAKVAVSDPIIYIPTFVYTQLVEVLEDKIYHLGI